MFKHSFLYVFGNVVFTYKTNRNCHTSYSVIINYELLTFYLFTSITSQEK